jgi:hypothetical protein
MAMCCMCSSPPTICTSSPPAMIACAAWLIACKLEPHSRLTVVPAASAGQAGHQGHRPGDVQALLALLLRIAQHDVFDFGRIDAGAIDQRADDGDGQVVAADVAKDAFSLWARPMGVRTAIDNHGMF